jgi:transcriptional antiterminator NusG
VSENVPSAAELAPAELAPAEQPVPSAAGLPLPVSPEDAAHAPPADTATEAVGAEPAAGANSDVGAAEPAAPEALLVQSAPLAQSVPADAAASVIAPKERAVAKRDRSAPIEEIAVVDEPPKMNWYILKVQSNREDSIREVLQRRVKVEGLEKYFGDVIVPTEMVSEFKGGKKRVVKRKLYPGYLVVNMEINEETWFLVRETPGIGDFTGSAGKPTPMLPHEVQRIVAKQEEKSDEAPKLKISFSVSDRVKINEGTFENFEGSVDSIDEANGRVTVMINIFGRSTPVELEYWQIEAL